MIACVGRYVLPYGWDWYLSSSSCLRVFDAMGGTDVSYSAMRCQLTSRSTGVAHGSLVLT
eukprot:2062670-Rhodomonas_salina.2